MKAISTILIPAAVAAALAVGLVLRNGSPSSPASSHANSPAESTSHGPQSATATLTDAVYATALTKHQDMTFRELRKAVVPARDFVRKMPFDVEQARYFDLVRYRLKLTDDEVKRVKRNGFVSVDQRRPHNFISAYQQIYTSDLPLFITSDSILHALHKSYDAMLKELEVSLFRPTLEEILTSCHQELQRVRKNLASNEHLASSLADVDLYLSVARRLLTEDPPVGPVYSYYEFWQPADERLTDEEWKQRLEQNSEPARPAWTDAFRSRSEDRPTPAERVSLMRQKEWFHVVVKQRSGGGTSYRLPLDRKTIQRMSSHPSIHAMDLGNSWIGDEELLGLSTLPDLRSLNLSGTKVTDQGLTAIGQHQFLQSLNLSSTAITDANLGELAALRNLHTLDLRNTRTSEASVRRLQTDLKHTKILR